MFAAFSSINKKSGENPRHSVDQGLSTSPSFIIMRDGIKIKRINSYFPQDLSLATFTLRPGCTESSQKTVTHRRGKSGHLPIVLPMPVSKKALFCRFY